MDTGNSEGKPIVVILRRQLRFGWTAEKTMRHFQNHRCRETQRVSVSQDGLSDELSCHLITTRRNGMLAQISVADRASVYPCTGRNTASVDEYFRWRNERKI
jgi:hypothetical protein